MDQLIICKEDQQAIKSLLKDYGISYNPKYIHELKPLFKQAGAYIKPGLGQDTLLIYNTALFYEQLTKAFDRHFQRISRDFKPMERITIF